MTVANPNIANLGLMPIDGTAAAPSIAFGGGLSGSSGTGIYGSYGAMACAISGADVMALSSTGVVVTGSLTASGGVVVTGQKYLIPAAGVAKVGGTAGWVVDAADNVSLVTCPASQTASKLIIPITGLKSGWTITAFSLMGQIESAGGTVTVDADLRSQTVAAADIVDASVASMTQLSVIADTAMSASNTNKGSLTVPVIDGQTFYMVLTVTTGSSCDIALLGVLLTVSQA